MDKIEPTVRHFSRDDFEKWYKECFPDYGENAIAKDYCLIGWCAGSQWRYEQMKKEIANLRAENQRLLKLLMQIDVTIVNHGKVDKNTALHHRIIAAIEESGADDDEKS